jgi:GxxExxY protein
MTENELSKIIIDCAMEIHFNLGPGLFESVYEAIFAYELEQKGLQAERQKAVQISYKGIIFDEAFRADIIVNDLVIIELKSLEKTSKVHSKQLLTYLRLMDKKLGILINFGEVLLKDGIQRVVNGL